MDTTSPTAALQAALDAYRTDVANNAEAGGGLHELVYSANDLAAAVATYLAATR